MGGFEALKPTITCQSPDFAKISEIKSIFKPPLPIELYTICQNAPLDNFSSNLFENCPADRVLTLTPTGVNISILDKANIWTDAGESDPEVLTSPAR